MDGTDDQKQAVRNTIETRLKPTDANFVTWEDCAGVKFRELSATDNSANIRITFKTKGKDNWYWSALGRDATNRTKFPFHEPTMRLAGLPDEYPPSEFHRGNVLHEFGHALGLHHEHQSPALGVQLNEKAVIRDYKGDEERARRQVLDRIQDATNYTRFDKHSIMGYVLLPVYW